jgi:hypothetical protein
MKYKIILTSGIFVPILYLTTVFIGSILKPDQTRYSISELLESGAPDKILLNSLFSIYIIFIMIFAVGLLLFISSYSRSENYNKFGKIGVTFILIAGFLGLILILLFPLDPTHTSPKILYTMHLIIAWIISISTMLSVLFFVLWFKKVKLKYLSFYSLISLIAISIFGIIADLSAGEAGPFLGLMQKITIFAFLQWMAVIAIWILNLKIYSREKKVEI